MYCAATSESIAKYILLCILCYRSVFSATTETIQKLADDEDGEVYGEGENILRNDFFRFTTRKRYIWEDWTVPTRDYKDYGGSSASTDFIFYVFVPIFIVGFLVSLAYICIKNMQNESCCTFESDSSSDRFTTVHRPPERRRDLAAQVHIPPSGTNQYSALRRELFGEPARPDLFPGNGNAVDTAGISIISFVDSPYASSFQSRIDPEIAGAEKPPDYSTVTLNDLVYPTRPAFPVVKADNETPPPEYGKENPLFK